MNVTNETSNNIQIQLLIEQEHKTNEINEYAKQQRTEQYHLRLQMMEEQKKNKEQQQKQKHGYLEYDSNS